MTPIKFDQIINKVKIADSDYKLHYKLFHNLSHLLTTANDDKINNSSLNIMERNSRSISQFNTGWTQTKTFAEAIELATFGWPQGLETCWKFTKEYSSIFEAYFPQQNIADEIVYDIEGSSVNIDRYLAGDENCMKKRKKSSNKLTYGNKLQRIIVECSESSFVNSETIFMFGALATALVNSMENYGFRTELIVRESTVSKSIHGADKVVVHDIVIKQLDESPDYNKIGFIFGHPSFLRRIMFSIAEQLDNDLLPYFGPAGSYGVPIRTNGINTLENDLYLSFPVKTTNPNIQQMIEIFKKSLQAHFVEINFGE